MSSEVLCHTQARQCPKTQEGTIKLGGAGEQVSKSYQAFRSFLEERQVRAENDRLIYLAHNTLVCQPAWLETYYPPTSASLVLVLQEKFSLTLDWTNL